MTAKNDISDELKGLSEAVAGINRLLPLSAPEKTYFEDLPGQILGRIGSSSETAVLQSLKKNTPFGGANSVPDGYFEGFAARMLDKIRSAPDQEYQSPLLLSIGKKTPYQVPEEYFNSFSPLLAGLNTTPTYQAPEGYFEDLSSELLDRIREEETPLQQPARIISMSQKTSRRSSWLRYTGMSVAASVILIFGWLSIRTSLNKPANTEGNSDITKSLSNVSDQDIQNYLDTRNTPLADELANSTAALDISDNDLNGMLSDVSDADLKQYMEDHGNVNVKDLPTN